MVLTYHLVTWRPSNSRSGVVPKLFLLTLSVTELWCVWWEIICSVGQTDLTRDGGGQKDASRDRDYHSTKHLDRQSHDTMTSGVVLGLSGEWAPWFWRCVCVSCTWAHNPWREGGHRDLDNLGQTLYRRTPGTALPDAVISSGRPCEPPPASSLSFTNLQTCCLKPVTPSARNSGLTCYSDPEPSHLMEFSRNPHFHHRVRRWGAQHAVLKVLLKVLFIS